MYGIPPFRFTSYGIGIIMGYILRNEKPHQLSQIKKQIGWSVALASLLIVAVLTSRVHYYLTPFNVAMFSAFTPVFFSLFFSWIIYVSYHQSGSELLTYFSAFSTKKLNYILYGCLFVCPRSYSLREKN